MASRQSYATSPKPSIRLPSLDFQGKIMDREKPSRKVKANLLVDSDDEENAFQDDPYGYQSPFVSNEPAEPPNERAPSETFSPPRPTTEAAGSAGSTGTARIGAAKRLVIGIDYGTTYTGLAYATPTVENAKLRDIQLIRDWGPGMRNHPKIPSVISYSHPANSEEQWGTNISPNAVTMVNTKMELDIGEKKIDELELIQQVLDSVKNLEFEAIRKAGNNLEYTWKDPERIVTDYLNRVYNNLDRMLRPLGNSLREKLEVDIVVTIPVNWSYRAQNSTYRAIQRAGFNQANFLNLKEFILVTEPEVAAIYTARYLKEDKKTEFLKMGECFILCDAGGGTVDCVAYQVVKLEPYLELKRISFASSGKCGSAFIDASFKTWLRDKVLGERYKWLDPRSTRQTISPFASEGKDMRELMKKFDEYKRLFHTNAEDTRFFMPKGTPPRASDGRQQPQSNDLHHTTVKGVLNEGQLTINNATMRNIFDDHVYGVVKLIDGQLQQVERKGYGVKNVFLVGGFGESRYLQEALTRSLSLRGKITIRRPDQEKAWTAVVQGAVIYGIEKEEKQHRTTMTSCEKSYGVVLNETERPHVHHQRDQIRDTLTDTTMAYQQLKWMVKRGDLILSSEAKVEKQDMAFHFEEHGDRSFNLPVYEYIHDDDDLPERYQTGQHELRTVAELKCNLQDRDLNEFEHSVNARTGVRFYIVQLICKATITKTSTVFELWWNDVQLDSKKVNDGDVDSFRSWS